MVTKWLQKGIKREGRFEGQTVAQIQATIDRLHKKAESGKLSKEERSLLSAAILAIRLKSGEFNKGSRAKASPKAASQVKRAVRTGRIPRP